MGAGAAESTPPWTVPVSNAVASPAPAVGRARRCRRRRGRRHPVVAWPSGATATPIAGPSCGRPTAAATSTAATFVDPNLILPGWSLIVPGVVPTRAPVGPLPAPSPGRRRLAAEPDPTPRRRCRTRVHRPPTRWRRSPPGRRRRSTGRPTDVGVPPPTTAAADGQRATGVGAARRASPGSPSSRPAPPGWRRRGVVAASGPWAATTPSRSPTPTWRPRPPPVASATIPSAWPASTSPCAHLAAQLVRRPVATPPGRGSCAARSGDIDGHRRPSGTGGLPVALVDRSRRSSLVLAGGVPIGLLVAGAGHAPSPCPGLVMLGLSDDAELYVDLEALGLVTVEGPPATVTAIARAVVATLAVSPLADLVHIVTSGVDCYGFANEERVQSVSDPDAALDLTAALSAGVRQALGDGGTHDLRRLAPQEPWEPVVAILLQAELSSAQLAEVCRLVASGGVAVVTDAEVPGARYRLRTDGHGGCSRRRRAGRAPPRSPSDGGANRQSRSPRWITFPCESARTWTSTWRGDLRGSARRRRGRRRRPSRLRGRPGGCPLEIIGGDRDPEALAATAARRLAGDRVAGLLGLLARLLDVLRRRRCARHDRHPGLGHDLARPRLRTHRFNRLRRWADEGDPVPRRRRGRSRRSREEPVAGVNRLGTAPPRRCRSVFSTLR